MTSLPALLAWFAVQSRDPWLSGSSTLTLVSLVAFRTFDVDSRDKDGFAFLPLPTVISIGPSLSGKAGSSIRPSGAFLPQLPCRAWHPGKTGPTGWSRESRGSRAARDTGTDPSVTFVSSCSPLTGVAL